MAGWQVQIPDFPAFSGFRGAVDQARLGWRRNQNSIISRWNQPIYQWKVRQFAAEDPILARAATRSDIKLYAHRWQPPKWPYIDPLKDAGTDLLRMRNALSSPRRIQQERGENWETISTEIVEDNALAIRKAKTAAQAINSDFPDDAPVHWRELLSLPTPDGVQVNLTGQDETAATTTDGNSPNKQPAGRPVQSPSKNGKPVRTAHVLNGMPS